MKSSTETFREQAVEKGINHCTQEVATPCKLKLFSRLSKRIKYILIKYFCTKKKVILPWIIFLVMIFRLISNYYNESKRPEIFPKYPEKYSSKIYISFWSWILVENVLPKSLFGYRLLVFSHVMYTSPYYNMHIFAKVYLSSISSDSANIKGSGSNL